MAFGVDDLLIIAAITAIAASTTSAYGQYQQGKAAEFAADYQAKVNENNAKVAEYAAQDAARRGEEEARQIQRTYANRIAAGRAGFAAGNVALDSGSAGLWEVGANVTKAEDLATSKTNTQNDIWGLRWKGESLRSEAGALRIGGQNNAMAANIGAAGSLLSGASTAAASFYAYNARTNASGTSSAANKPYGGAYGWTPSR